LTPTSATALRVIAAEAARAAGELLRERFEAGGERATGAKSTPTDLVSDWIKARPADFAPGFIECWRIFAHAP